MEKDSREWKLAQSLALFGELIPQMLQTKATIRRMLRRGLVMQGRRGGYVLTGMGAELLGVQG